MNLLVTLPTRSRPEKSLDVIKQYQRLSTYNNIRYVLSCDNDDDTMNNSRIISAIEALPNTTVVFNDNTTKVSAINSSVIGQDFDICIQASDDMLPQLTGYDTRVVDDMKKNYSDTDGVLWYNDGFWGNKLNTLCIFGKKYYDRFNYIYHPSYKSLWCDNEFTEVSKLLNRCTYSNDIIIKHSHCNRRNDSLRAQRDKLYILNDTYDQVDKANFKKREARGFPHDK